MSKLDFKHLNRLGRNNSLATLAPPLWAVFLRSWNLGWKQTSSKTMHSGGWPHRTTDSMSRQWYLRYLNRGQVENIIRIKGNAAPRVTVAIRLSVLRLYSLMLNAAASGSRICCTHFGALFRFCVCILNRMWGDGPQTVWYILISVILPRWFSLVDINYMPCGCSWTLC